MNLPGLIYDLSITAAILGAYALGRFDRAGARLALMDLRNVDVRADEPSFLRGQQIQGRARVAPSVGALCGEHVAPASIPYESALPDRADTKDEFKVRMGGGRG